MADTNSSDSTELEHSSQDASSPSTASDAQIDWVSMIAAPAVVWDGGQAHDATPVMMAALALGAAQNVLLDMGVDAAITTENAPPDTRLTFRAAWGVAVDCDGLDASRF